MEWVSLQTSFLLKMFSTSYSKKISSLLQKKSLKVVQKYQMKNIEQQLQVLNLIAKGYLQVKHYLQA